MAFTKNIGSNSIDSHQTSPAYVLTFTRYSNRDIVNYDGEDFLATRKPLVVVSDAISLSVKNSKSSPVSTFNCVLKQGDINYLTAVSPGDYVTVNMVNWEEKAMEIRTRALNGKPVNRVDDGFKGLFKILDVNMVLAVDDNGIKQYQAQVTARGFDEFNNILYFNPALPKAVSDSQGFLFLNAFDNWSDIVQGKEKNNVQELLKEVIKRSIGEGIRVLDKDTPLNQISAYELPSQVATLLNVKGGKTLADINKYYFGIWNTSFRGKTNTSNLNSGFTNFFQPEKPEFGPAGSGVISFFDTGKGNKLQGSRQIAFQDFQQVKVWSLIQDYSNPVLNESYTCYRLGPDNHVYPSLVIRQKPFNNRSYENFVMGEGSAGGDDIANHTKFLDLPRWKVSPSLIKSLNLGRSDSGRINFVQVFSRSLSMDANLNNAAQIAQRNFVEDKKDVRRHGRKPYIVNCNYDYPTSTKKLRARQWALLVADWVFNGHLKMNGTMQTVGIEDNICIGDNLEFDDIVYHIESITHSINLSGDGRKSFRTNLSLSMGISERSNASVPIYAEMDHTDSYTRRLDDHGEGKEGVLPGFSDTQDLPSRELGEEVTETLQESFSNPNRKDKGKKIAKKKVTSIGDLRKRDEDKLK
jgi:hypothetical protein